MEKELLELFEAATKAADDAATNASSSGGSEEARCIDILKQLKDFPVTKDTLIATQVGKRVRNLKRHPSAKIQALASDLIETWKKAIIEETARNKSSGSSEDKNSAKVEKTEIVKVGKDQKADPMKIEKVAMTKITKVDRVERIKSEKAPFSDTTKVEKIEIVKLDKKSNETECVKVEMISKSKEDKQASGMKKPLQASNCPPKLTSMFKCNDAARDKLREIIADALSRVSSEATEEIREEVNACDPIQVAVSVESVLFDKLGRRTGAQSLKYRSIVFNMQDRNNPDLRRRVLLGHIKPERLIVMTPEELASDRRKCQNNQIKEKALFDCERPDASKATTDQFKCGRCGQRKCTYYQMQTRSADEPMTTFVTCVNCNNHWKFC